MRLSDRIAMHKYAGFRLSAFGFRLQPNSLAEGRERHLPRAKSREPRAARYAGLGVLAVLAMVLLDSSAGAAAPASDDEVSKTLRTMQEELNRLREDNESMRSEIDHLRAQTDDNWLTEKRAEEIRALVADVLADADTRASLLDDGLMAGWSKGFFLADANGRFRLAIGGQMQFRWMFNFHDNDPPGPATDLDRYRSGFENTRTRLTFSGHVFGRDLTYLVRGGFQRVRTTNAGDATDPEGGYFNLIDAWVRYHLTDEWNVRAGQFKLPFSREFLVSSSQQLAVERSAVGDAMSLGRSQGLELAWISGPHRFAAAVSDGATDRVGGPLWIIGGFPDGSPVSTGAMQPTVEYAFTARYEHLVAGHWEQFEDFRSLQGEEFGLLVGGAVHAQRSEAGTTSPFRSHWYAYTLDASAEWGGANLFGSFTHFYVERADIGSLNIFGVVLHGGFYVAPKWEFFGRYEYGSLHSSELPDDLSDPAHIGTIGMNYYMDGHAAKWTTDLGVGFTRLGRTWTGPTSGITGWRLDNDDTDLQFLMRTQIQLLF